MDDYLKTDLDDMEYDDASKKIKEVFVNFYVRDYMKIKLY